MTSYLMLIANGKINKPLVSYTGEYAGTLIELQMILEKICTPREQSRSIHILALTEKNGICRFNAALLFDTHDDLKFTAAELLRMGITSPALELVVSTKNK